MKRNNILIALAALAASTSAVRAGDDHDSTTAAPSVPVAQRLMKIDLDVAVRHYEKLQDALRGSRLELLMDEGAQDASAAGQERLQRKIEILSKLTEETRQEILELGQALEKSAARAHVAAAQGAVIIPGFPGTPAGIAVPAQFRPPTTPGTVPVPGVPGSQSIPGQPAGGPPVPVPPLAPPVAEPPPALAPPSAAPLAGPPPTAPGASGPPGAPAQ